MPVHNERFYRNRVRSKDLLSFRVVVKETDLWVSAEKDLVKQTRDLVLNCRYQLENYIRMHPEFAAALSPQSEDPYAPPIVKEMIEATKRLDVGPMASVAGAVAQFVGEGLLEFTDQVIVENGGDVFLKAKRPVNVSIYAGDSRLSEKLGLVISERQMPAAVCSSSASVGHSLSMGIADAVCLLSRSAALADGAATSLGNRIKKKSHLENLAAWGGNIKGILGGVAIVEDHFSCWGDIELVEL